MGLAPNFSGRSTKGKAMGEDHYRAGRFAEALEAFRKEANLRMVGCALEALGQLEAAGELYQQAIEKAAWDARTHLALAGFELRRERWQPAGEAALAGMRCPYATPPVKYELGVILATVHMKLGNLPRAIEMLSELEKGGSDPTDVAWLRSKLLLMQGRRAEAEQLLAIVHESVSRELAKDATLSSRWTLLGDCCYARGDLEAAHRAYDRALQCPVVDWAACRGLGILAEKRSEAAEARGFYAKFLQLDPLNLAGPSIRQRMALLEKQTQPQ